LHADRAKICHTCGAVLTRKVAKLRRRYLHNTSSKIFHSRLTPFPCAARFTLYRSTIEEISMEVAKKVKGLLAGAFAALAASQALALGNLADIEIVDRATGRALPVHQHAGEAWVAGVPGAKYSIRVRNNHFSRVLAVMSVDGVNVVSGETAGSAQAGYVYGRYERGEIAGWRKSDSEIAAFEFVASPQSYAERTGRPHNVGIIGVALFREKVPQRRAEISEPLGRFAPYKPAAPSAAESASAPAGNAPQSAAAPLAQPVPDASKRGRAQSNADAVADTTTKLGTGHGEREASHTTRVTFARESETPNEVIRIRYDSRENLLAMGVIRESFAWRNPFLNPFPRDQYVPDPPTMR
jgi:hypothetical protein